MRLLFIICLGIGGVILTVALHAVATTMLFAGLQRAAPRLVERHPRLAKPILLGCSAGFLALKHTADIMFWAVAFYLFSGDQELSKFEDSVYFSFVTYTTLGYGDIVLQGPVRLWCGIEAMNGILLFGWSTAALFFLVQQLWGVNSSAK